MHIAGHVLASITAARGHRPALWAMHACVALALTGLPGCRSGGYCDLPEEGCAVPRPDCVDLDGDGHFLWLCAGGDDHCEDDEHNWTPQGCEACRDADGDGFGPGCDRGPDCAEADPSCHAGACCPPGCADADGDGAGAGPDCEGPEDCDPTDPFRWEPAHCAAAPERQRLLAAGGAHTCALAPGAGLVCAGENASGQLGDGTVEPSRRPVPTVMGPAWQARAVVAGEAHTCALDPAGSVHCWGSNGLRQLATGSEEPPYATSPLRVPGLAATALVSGASHVCAVHEDGPVWCWGDNRSGQVTVMDSEAIPEGLRLYTPGWVRSLAAGSHHTCVVLCEGRVLCWGGLDRPVPLAVVPSDGCPAEGEPAEPEIAFGRDDPNQDGCEDRPEDLRGVAEITAGRDFTCGLKGNGVLCCWGTNDRGELGQPFVSSARLPVRPGGLLHVVAVSAGARHACAIRYDRSLWCWGDNTYGQLGDGSDVRHYLPVPVGLGRLWMAVSAGRDHTCALSSEDRIFCWGRNEAGQLGDGTTEDRAWPTPVSGP